MITKRIKLDPGKRKRILSDLQKVLGGRATDNQAVLYSYSGSGMPYPKAVPDFVVRPANTEEVRKIVLIAGKYQVPVTPVATGGQEAGTYPWFGGIVVDTNGMNRIHEIDETAGYAVIEPGVSFGSISNELQKRNMRLAVGSFPQNVSCLGNYIMTAVNSHRTLGPTDDLLCLEVVLADGTVVNTGTRAFSHTYPSSSWNYQSNSFPNIKNLFIDHAGTLGIVTKGSIRIYSKGEAQAMPLSAFDSYPKALEYMIKIGRGNLVQHVCSWHWALYTIIDHLGKYGRGAPAEIMLKEPWEKPEGRPYIIVVPSIAGFREQVKGAAEAAERITKDLGGAIFTEECIEKWPGAYKFFKDHYMDHRPTNQFQGGYGEAIPMMPIVMADPRKIAGLEDWGLKYLRKSGFRIGLTYYSHANDQSRSIFLRMTPFVQHGIGQTEMDRLINVRRKYMEEAFKKYGAVPLRPEYGLKPGELLSRTGGHAAAVRAVKKALDPENIMNSGMSSAIYGDLSAKNTKKAKKGGAK